MKKPRKKLGSTHYRDEQFLRRLGEHCRKLRIQRGYSIDRMARESNQLSPSVIHRLETGSGNSTIATLTRYAEILNLPLSNLLNFADEDAGEKFEVLPSDSPRVKKEAFKTLIPIYSLKAAAGYFGDGQTVETEGWAVLPSIKQRDKKMFIAQAIGESMEPQITNGDYLLFHALPEMVKQDRIVLAQYQGPADPDTGGSYAVKKYAKRQGKIILSPINNAFEPIVIEKSQAQYVRVIAELVKVLKHV